MKKSAVAVMGAIAASTAITFALAEFFYESVLNVDFAKKVSQKTGLMDDTLIKLFHDDPLFRDSMLWFKGLKLQDNVITDEQGTDIHAYILRNENKTNKWAVCIHGYMGSPAAQSPFIKHFYDNGYNVLCPYLKAHGKDTNKYCSMGWYDKNIIISWIDYLIAENPDCEIVLHGVSMGAATVMLATGEKLPVNVKCAVSDCGYTSCKEVYKHVLNHKYHMPAFPLLPVANAISVVRGNFDFTACSPVKAVSKSVTPTLFVHGTEDNFVPYRMLNEVFDACTAEKERFDVPGAVHAVALAFDPEGYFNTMDRFISAYTE